MSKGNLLRFVLALFFVAGCASVSLTAGEDIRIEFSGGILEVIVQPDNGAQLVFHEAGSEHTFKGGTWVFSDVHGNLEYLELAIEKLRAMGMEQLLFLGDVLGRSGHNRQCLDLLFAENALMISGNHDRAAMEFLPDSYQQQLKSGSKKILRLGDSNEILCSHTTTDKRVSTYNQDLTIKNL